MRFRLDSKGLLWSLLFLYLLLLICYGFARIIMSPAGESLLQSMQLNPSSLTTRFLELFGDVAPANVSLDDYRLWVLRALSKFGVFAFFITTLFILSFVDEIPPEENRKMIVMIFLNGLLIRILMAWIFRGNNDMDYWTMEKNVAMAGKNIYSEVWFFQLLAILVQISLVTRFDSTTLAVSSISLRGQSLSHNR